VNYFAVFYGHIFHNKSPSKGTGAERRKNINEKTLYISYDITIS
jgi:hypothetical protein